MTAAIGVALVLAAAIAFAQVVPIDQQEYPPDPFGPGGGGGGASDWYLACGTLTTYCNVDGTWVHISCTQCRWYYLGVPIGDPFPPCSLTCPGS